MSTQFLEKRARREEKKSFSSRPCIWRNSQEVPLQPPLHMAAAAVYCSMLLVTLIKAFLIKPWKNLEHRVLIFTTESWNPNQEKRWKEKYINLGFPHTSSQFLHLVKTKTKIYCSPMLDPVTAIFLQVLVPFLELLKVFWRFWVRFWDWLKSFNGFGSDFNFLANPGPVVELSKFSGDSELGSLKKSWIQIRVLV